MSRGRSDDELIGIINGTARGCTGSVKSLYEHDFEDAFNPELLKPILLELRDQKLREFIRTRYGHLREFDFIRFVNLFLEDPIRTPITAKNLEEVNVDSSRKKQSSKSKDS